MQNTEMLIKTAAQMGATAALEALGISAGTISQTKARKTYGTWFRDAEARGRIKPVHQGEGKTATKLYSVNEILALRASDRMTADLQEPQY